ncbi:hypothetical protein ABZX92_27075 [Lentzea sp. NPDC006480]|uniref:hypothetical protein n=1 Tax=Lentzea sp. NPDC006480 TaxID=3157176 RepID=UPI00339E6D80
MRLRRMTADEYRAATEHREAESVRLLGRVMPEELALQRVRPAPRGSCPTAWTRPGITW